MYKELLEYIVKNLVTNVEAVKITEEQKENKTVLVLEVAVEDMGRIIGKEGRIIKSIREIIHSNSAKDGKKVLVEVKEV